MATPTFRFAPSPTGRLHLGHALSALENERAAREAGGRLLLRIENTDVTRCTPENEAGILEDLDWLGVAFDGEIRRQSDHFPTYQAALGRLAARDLVYPAFLTRGELRGIIAEAEGNGPAWPRDPDGAPLYPPEERDMSDRQRRRRIASGEPFAWRLDMGEAVRLAGAPGWREAGEGPRGETGTVQFDARRWGDVVLGRKEFPASYHLSVVVDDALQGVTDVVRGRDLFYATAIHRVLQTLLGLPAPNYRHHRLLLDTDGRKLSKSAASTPLADLRAEGVTPAEIRQRLGFA